MNDAPIITVYQAVNSVSCLLMMCFALAAAKYIPGRGRWCLRFSLCSVAILLAFQVASPWMENTASVAWHTAMLHMLIAGSLIRWRKETLAFLRAKFGEPEEAANKTMRRAKDFTELA